ncbi:hypothetical protein AMTR_s00007p00245730 [Amborella trichopoda]|uniref:Uncharacterized protein n=1 Tax=Amborella trichopoda TaxID=13333 RepID=W1PCL0_AMBTC|nr:hypothetical protein AMTR_s00007p00245730 [Amborella trichopoda]
METPNQKLTNQYGDSIPRLSHDELEEGKQWLSETFHLIRYEDDSFPFIKWVIDLAKAAVLRYGVRGLVIDPYNELDHQSNLSSFEEEDEPSPLTSYHIFAAL